MSCYYPLTAYPSLRVNPATGKRSMVFNVNQGFRDQEVQLPCGRCAQCRLKKAAQWATRCHHEASLHQDNMFITLTYNNAHLPKSGSLSLDHHQKFMKRLRKFIHPLKARFLMCGEYGEKTKRPHYHYLIFGFKFNDLKFFRNTKTGHPVYRSKQLEKIWTYGYSEIGNVTFESANYVARYTLKKTHGEQALLKYTQFDLETGLVLNELKPEFNSMSRRPGVANEWFKKYGQQKYEDKQDFVIINARKLQQPKYYDNQFEILNPDKMSEMKLQRKIKAKNNLDNTHDRLMVKKQIQEQKLTLLNRDYENSLNSEALNTERAKL